MQERGTETPAEPQGCSSAAVPTVGPCSSQRALGSGQKPACFPKFTAGQRSRAAAGWRRSSALPRLCRQELSCGWACSTEDEECSPAPRCQISLTIACFSIHRPQPRTETGSGWGAPLPRRRLASTSPGATRPQRSVSHRSCHHAPPGPGQSFPVWKPVTETVNLGLAQVTAATLLLCSGEAHWGLELKPPETRRLKAAITGLSGFGSDPKLGQTRCPGAVDSSRST